MEEREIKTERDTHTCAVRVELAEQVQLVPGLFSLWLQETHAQFNC